MQEMRFVEVRKSGCNANAGIDARREMDANILGIGCKYASIHLTGLELTRTLKTEKD